MSNAKVGVVGAGSWGTALAWVLANNGCKVTLWSVIESEIEMLKEFHEQKDKLPGTILPDSVDFTTDLKSTVEGKDMIVMAVPSIFTRSTAHNMKDFISEGQIIVNVAKGIEEDTLLTLSEIIEQEIPQSKVAVLCGPTHAEEVGKGMATTIVAGCKDIKVAEYIQEVFMNAFFRVYTGTDVLGMEIGSALKNVIALAAGMADGLGCGDNAKAAIITRGIHEISGLGAAMGCSMSTFAGLTGIGDLIVTCASMHSRNRRAGILMGQGATMQEAMDEVKMVVEGVYSAKAAMGLAKKYNVSLPIIEEVNAVLFEGKKVVDVLPALMQREKKKETLD